MGKETCYICGKDATESEHTIVEDGIPLKICNDCGGKSVNNYSFGMNVRCELNEDHVRLAAFYIHVHDGVAIHKIGKTRINKELKRLLSQFGSDITSLFGENLILEYGELPNSEKIKYEKVIERYFYRNPTRFI